jgi:hypothetical protein
MIRDSEFQRLRGSPAILESGIPDSHLLADEAQSGRPDTDLHADSEARS